MARHHIACVLAAFSILYSGGCGDRAVTAEDGNLGAPDEGPTDTRGTDLADRGDLASNLDLMASDGGDGSFDGGDSMVSLDLIASDEGSHSPDSGDSSAILELVGSDRENSPPDRGDSNIILSDLTEIEREDSLYDRADLDVILDVTGPRDLAIDDGGVVDSPLTEQLDRNAPKDSLFDALVLDIPPTSDIASPSDSLSDAGRSDLARADLFSGKDIPPPEICDDGLDNNQNGMVDCADPDCNNRACGPHLLCYEGSCQEEGPLAWVKQAGGAGYDICSSVTVRSDGVALAACYPSEDSAIFGEGEAGEITFIRQGLEDVPIAMYNTDDGTLAGIIRSEATVNTIMANFDGGWTVGGLVHGRVVLGKGEAGETVLIGSVIGDVYTARYNADGTLAWANSMDGGITLFTDYSFDLTSDEGVIVMGAFEGYVGFGEQTLLSRGASDIYLARYNSDGAFAWAKTAGGVQWVTAYDQDVATGFAVLPDDGALVTGNYACGSAVFGEGEAGETWLAGNECDYYHSVSTSFIARYNANGTLMWAKNLVRLIEGDLAPRSADVSSFPDGGGVVTGAYWGVVVFGEGETGETWFARTDCGSCSQHSNGFLARYNGEGTLIWANSFDTEDGSYGTTVAALPDGGVLVSGFFTESEIVFGSGEAGQTILQPTGEHYSYFLASYNPDGTLAWAKNFGGEIYDIEILPEGDALLTGKFSGTAVFGQGEPGETTLTSYGESDIFVARYRLSAHGSIHPQP